MPKGPNKEQREIIDTTDGIIVVDAGPGTGKTQTITDRYVNLIKQGISPSEILMVTFTNNAADEMRGRIRENLIKSSNQIRREDENLADVLMSSCDGIKTSTFDAYCLRIVLNSPDVVSNFFGFDECLSRGATQSSNPTINLEYFESFYAEFSKAHSGRYRKEGKDFPALMADHIPDLFSMVDRLMSLGIIPLKDCEWFRDGKKRLLGDRDEALKALRIADEKWLSDLMDKGAEDTWSDDFPRLELQQIRSGEREGPSDKTLIDVVDEDRELFLYFIWDIYYEYIHRSVRDNRLTFSLVRIMAFAALYSEKYVRSQNAVDYMMVDEFQDTDELQMMICLMLLKRPNLCVVGDWKQGIYGFRNATVENLRQFEKKVRDYVDLLGNRVEFESDALEFNKISLKMNYRSSQPIIDLSFKAMDAPGSSDEVVVLVPEDITLLTSSRETEDEHRDLYRRYTGCEFWYSDDKASEFTDIADKITEYVYSKKYKIVKDGEIRDPRFEDIAVLFRTGADCTEMYKVATSRGIPAFLQGDISIMSSVPGKLALAWLRFVNNIRDRRGITAILTYMGYNLPQIRYMFAKEADGTDHLLERLPPNLLKERDFLMGKRRRPNDLLTSIFAFHQVGESGEEADVAQAIIRTVSSSYDGSLMTIPDIIRLLEEDIDKDNDYQIDGILGTGAVTIQTMHMSKGLQYPIVIIGRLNANKMPSNRSSNSVLTYDRAFGLRCRLDFIRSNNSMEGITNSWRSKIIARACRRDYDEERRLFFVSMSRAKQYLFLSAGPNVSTFYAHVAGGEERGLRPERKELPKEDRSDMVTKRPDIPDYSRRRRNIAVHDIMEYVEGASDDGKGKEYGTRVHVAAQQMALGKDYDSKLPETVVISRILKGMGGAVFRPECDCALPVGDVTIRGVIDLLADFGDRIEIHDWKTDADKRNLESYIVQLSVYAHVARRVRDVPVRCFIDFVRLDETVEVKPIPIEDIEEKVEDYIVSTAVVDQ